MEQNIHKFLLAENPVNNKSFELFIYSTREQSRGLIKVESVEMAKVIELNEEETVHTLFFTSKSTGLPEFYQLSVVDNIDIREDKLSSVLRDAGKWYKNFMIWEEKQMFEGNAEHQLVKDFNQKVKGLKIIVSQSENMWIFIFRGRIRVFSSDQKGFTWLSEEFNINKKDLSKGNVQTVEELEDVIIEKLEDV